MLLALGGLCLLGLFSNEISDTDFWWHLKTGQFVLQRRALPVPDVFSYTADLGRPAYSGEEKVRYFNLTHEWLAQAVWYVIYRIGGFPAVVLFKALLLAFLCAIAGFLAARRAGDFRWGLLAAAAAASLAVEFAADRPALITFLLVAVFVWILECGRPLWLLPALSVVWANSHGGFFLGWVILAIYTLTDRRLWRVALISVAVSGLNPSFFRIVEILAAYRQSYLTQTLIEWSRPYLWGPPYAFNILLYTAAAVMALSWRRVALRDGLLFLAFGAASLLAYRNLTLTAFLAPILIVAYLPRRPALPSITGPLLALLLSAGLAAGIASGRFFQLRAALWKFPAGAADFLLARNIQAPLFNTYEYGGYLIWRLWPRQRVFIDGRALNESVYQDYVRALNASDQRQVLDRYRIGVVVANAFEYTTGTLYPLVLDLANAAETDWQLVYEDPQALVFLRRPPPDIPSLPKSRVTDHLETECRLHVEKDPELSLCARTLGYFFLQSRDPRRARSLLALYLANARDRDADAEKTYQQLLSR